MTPGTAASPSRSEVARRLSDPEGDFRIFPRPEKIGYGSIDLRLGSVFLTAERSSLTEVAVDDIKRGAKLFRETRISSDGRFIMHPHQFVLACTYEYICLPVDLVGLIQSRSTFGRMGLIAATAAFVGPGYKGCPTLELVNLGEVAIKLKPHEDFCQLVLFTSSESELPPPSRYQCMTRPVFARLPLPA